MCDAMGFEPECTQFTSLTVTDGKLANFAVNATPIDDRLAAPGAATQSGGATVTLLGAYESVQADSLIVVLDIANSTEPLNLNVYSAEYITSDGRQVTVGDAVGPIQLRAGASASVVLSFPSQTIGGTVYLTGSDQDYNPIEWVVPLA